MLQRVMPDSGRGAGSGEDRKTNNLPFFEVKIISTGLAVSTVEGKVIGFRKRPCVPALLSWCWRY